MYELDWQYVKKGWHLRPQDRCRSSVDVPEEAELAPQMYVEHNPRDLCTRRRLSQER